MPLKGSGQLLSLTCEDCGQAFVLTGRPRSAYLYNRKRRKGWKTRCAACWDKHKTTWVFASKGEWA